MGALPELPRVGASVDRYRVLSPIATGGMAAVFAVQRRSLGGFDKLLALKVILPHLASERYFLDMFLDEARIASQIQHPNVVGVFDVVEHGGLPCMVMEYLHGRSFSSVLEPDRACPVALVLFVLAAAAEGLSAAHRACGRDGLPLGIVHRDVSPQNVHVGYDGQVRLVDFGIAAARGRLSSTRAGTLKGKLGYLAPEQIDGSEAVTSRADVWSFGVMAWQALAGVRLFTEDNDAATMWNVLHRGVRPLDPSTLAASIGDDAARRVCDAILACLRRAPAERIELDDCARTLRESIAGCVADPRASLGAYMVRAFADEKRGDDEVLERTLSHAQIEPAPVVVAADPDVVASASVPRGRRPWLAAAAIGLGVLAMGSWWASARGSGAAAGDVDTHAEAAVHVDGDATPVVDATPAVAAPQAIAASPEVASHPVAATPSQPSADLPVTAPATDGRVEVETSPAVASSAPTPTSSARARRSKARPRGATSTPTPGAGKLFDSPYR